MNPEQKGIRRRRTQAEVQQLVAEFLSSGMGQSEFCRHRSLSWDTLNRHLQKQPKKRKIGRRRKQLVAVELASARPTERNGFAGLAVVLENGRRIEVGPGFDAPMLVELVKVLERV